MEGYGDKIRLVRWEVKGCRGERERYMVLGAEYGMAFALGRRE